MCGLAGILNSRDVFSSGQVQGIARCVSFRGPDNTGIRVLNEALQPSDTGNNIVFFNRLAIIDVDPRSDQPFENERYLLIFNGEIYNYREIRKDLEGAGIKFNTSSDTEVLFQSLILYGEKALPKLNGMFAFFFLDKKKQTFLMSRDRLGIKPLYYCQKDKSLSFGSELNSLLRLSPGPFNISFRAVEMYLWLQYVPTPHTMIEEVFKLPPGHYLQGSLDQIKAGVKILPKLYWDAYESALSEQISEPSELEEILKNSLLHQLNADVPLGLFLSSGIDSSLLAALVNKYFSKDKTFDFFTVAFNEETSKDESRDAQAFIQGFNNPNLLTHILSIDSSFIADRLMTLYKYYDEPFADSASLLNWVISQKAREHVTVVISGDGADELFWGYPRYAQWQQFSRRASSLIFPGLVQKTAKLLPDSRFKYNVSFASEPDPVQRHLNLFLPSGMRFMIEQSILQYPMWATDKVGTIASRGDLPEILDLKMYLADAMLYKVDRSSMAASLEVRVPYLDNNVLDFALHLPFRFKSNEKFRHKAVLKDLLHKLAPHYNFSLGKKGFAFPLEQWMRKEWKDIILSTISRDQLIELGLDPEPYLRLVREFYEKNSRHFTDVWYLFNLLLWLHQFKKVTRPFL